ncbi:MAG: hypothetical protein P0116_08460 [Candidatus Nitrosocosmicus sp.]|nr:hypothetical protein [Candidatus Nitrosocosmicus sp.]
MDLSRYKRDNLDSKEITLLIFLAPFRAYFVAFISDKPIKYVLCMTLSDTSSNDANKGDKELTISNEEN